MTIHCDGLPCWGPAYLSLHTCMLEMQAGLLALLPMPGNPFEREWYVVHLAARPLPKLAEAFEQFLCSKGQSEILKQMPATVAPGAAAQSRRRPRRASAGRADGKRVSVE